MQEKGPEFKASLWLRNGVIFLGLAAVFIVGLIFAPYLTLGVGAAIAIGLGIKKGIDRYKNTKNLSDKPIEKSNPDLESSADLDMDAPEPDLPRPSQFVTSATPNLHKNVGIDSFKHVSQFLTPAEVAALKATDKSFAQGIKFDEHEITQKYLEKFGKPGDTKEEKLKEEKLKEEKLKEEKLALFKAACLDVKDNYPPEMIEAFGLYDLAALPVFDMAAFKQTLGPHEKHDPIRYIHAEPLNGNKVMRGIWPDTNPENPKRVFICCINDSYLGEQQSVVTIIQNDYLSYCSAFATGSSSLMSGENVLMTSPRVQGLFSAVKEVMDGHKPALSHYQLDKHLKTLSSGDKEFKPNPPRDKIRPK